MRGSLATACALAAITLVPSLPAEPADFREANLAFLRGAAERADAPLDAAGHAELERIAGATRHVHLQPALEGHFPPVLDDGPYVGWMQFVCVTFFGNCPSVAVPTTLPFPCAAVPVGTLSEVWFPRHPEAHFQPDFAILILHTTSQAHLSSFVVPLAGPATFRGSGCLTFQASFLTSFEGNGVITLD